MRPCVYGRYAPDHKHLLPPIRRFSLSALGSPRMSIVMTLEQQAVIDRMPVVLILNSLKFFI